MTSWGSFQSFSRVEAQSSSGELWSTKKAFISRHCNDGNLPIKKKGKKIKKLSSKTNLAGTNTSKTFSSNGLSIFLQTIGSTLAVFLLTIDR